MPYIRVAFLPGLILVSSLLPIQNSMLVVSRYGGIGRSSVLQDMMHKYIKYPEVM